MHIKLLRNTVADGQPVSIGQTLDVSDATGKTLVQMGKAVEFPSPVGEGRGEGDSPSPVGEGRGEGGNRAPITVIAVEAQAPIEPVAEPIAPPKPKGRKGSQR